MEKIYIVIKIKQSVQKNIKLKLLHIGLQLIPFQTQQLEIKYFYREQLHFTASDQPLHSRKYRTSKLNLRTLGQELNIIVILSICPLCSNLSICFLTIFFFYIHSETTMARVPQTHVYSANTPSGRLSVQFPKQNRKEIYLTFGASTVLRGDPEWQVQRSRSFHSDPELYNIT